MSSPTDGYKLYNSAGQLIGEGTGHVQPGTGETLVTVSQRADDVDIKMLQEQVGAFSVLAQSTSAHRNFEAKYQSAVAYLAYREANPSAPDDDPWTLIDPVLYPEIYDEYLETFDLVPWNDIELCQRIVANHEHRLQVMRLADSQAEAQLRRKKILAEQSVGDVLGNYFKVSTGQVE